MLLTYTLIRIYLATYIIKERHGFALRKKCNNMEIVNISLDRTNVFKFKKNLKVRVD